LDGGYEKGEGLASPRLGLCETEYTSVREIGEVRENTYTSAPDKMGSRVFA
jgi:hypothetical protein